VVFNASAIDDFDSQAQEANRQASLFGMVSPGMAPGARGKRLCSVPGTVVSYTAAVEQAQALADVADAKTRKNLSVMEMQSTMNEQPLQPLFQEAQALRTQSGERLSTAVQHLKQVTTSSKRKAAPLHPAKPPKRTKDE
jgi:hypothetical protein